MLDVRMLGGLAISVDGEFVHRAFGAGGRLCAAYLFAFPNQVHRKERLVDLVWHDLGAKRGRHALNTTLWRLRRLLRDADRELGARIVTSTSEVILEARDTTPIDLHRFEETVSECFAVAPDERTHHRLSVAVSDYGGPFLDGEDDDWVLIERERLENLFIRSLIDLIRLLAIARRYDAAMDCCHRVLAADPLRESVQRSLMLLHILSGERMMAMQHYEKCRHLLRNECGVEPMPQTERLAALISTGEVFDRLEELCEKILGEGVRPARDPLVP